MDFVSLEEKRRKIHKRLFVLSILEFISICLAVAIAIAISGYIFRWPLLLNVLNSLDAKSIDALWYLYIPAIIIFCFASAIFYAKHDEKTLFSNKIKSNLFSEVLDEVIPKATYHMSGGISLGLIGSGLALDVSEMKREDYISGTINGIFFESCDYALQRSFNNENDEFNPQLSKTICRGRIIIFKLDRALNTIVRLCPKGKHELINDTGLNKIETESIEFNNLFDIYAYSEDKFFYYFTPSVIDGLIKLEEKYNIPLFISFAENRLFVAINDNKNHFEIDVKEPITANICDSIKDELRIIPSIFDVFKLGTNKFKNEEEEKEIEEVSDNSINVSMDEINNFIKNN